jgi:hypothetical protein
MGAAAQEGRQASRDAMSPQPPEGYLVANLDGGGVCDDPQGPLFRTQLYDRRRDEVSLDESRADRDLMAVSYAPMD